MTGDQPKQPSRSVEVLFVSPMRLGYLYVPAGLLFGAIQSLDALDRLTLLDIILVCGFWLVTGAVCGFVLGASTAFLFNTYTFIFNKGLVITIRDPQNIPLSPHGSQLERLSRRSAVPPHEHVVEDPEEVIVQPRTH